MESMRKESVDKLLAESEEFRDAYTEHHDYNKLVAKFEKKPILSAEEQAEKKRLKKLKLALKDKMEKLIAAAE